jgi:LysR family hydrogen peroxide-inducible transcriptional activator
MGVTLVPALALRGARTTDAGVIARPLQMADAYRRISLVSRKSFPRPAALEALAEVIVSSLPDSVRVPRR